MLKILLVVVSLSLITLTSWSHSGRTDASGCHHDRKHGGYHCHKSKSPSRKTSSYSHEETVFFNTKSKKIHSMKCMHAKQCTVNCVSMKRVDAIKRGGIPCGVCGGG